MVCFKDGVETGVGKAMQGQVSPIPAAGAVGWDWGVGGVLSQRDLHAMAGMPEQAQEGEWTDRVWHLCACVCCALAGVLAAMGAVTALVAWVKFSWNHV
jgi:hypothetical protein